MPIQDLKAQIARLPEQPGVYLYSNGAGETLDPLWPMLPLASGGTVGAGLTLGSFSDEPSKPPVPRTPRSPPNSHPWGHRRVAGPPRARLEARRERFSSWPGREAG